MLIYIECTDMKLIIIVIAIFLARILLSITNKLIIIYKITKEIIIIQVKIISKELNNYKIMKNLEKIKY